MAEKKRTAGRPKVHKSELATFSFRTTKDVIVAIQGAVAAIKLATGEVDTPVAMVVIDSLKSRLKALSNHNPRVVAAAIKSLDAALDDYEHVKR